MAARLRSCYDASGTSKEWQMTEPVTLEIFTDYV